MHHPVARVSIFACYIKVLVEVTASQTHTAFNWTWCLFCLFFARVMETTCSHTP